MTELPLLLRREPFGGLLFVPHDAVHIELDHEAYGFVRDHLAAGRAPRTDEERRLMASLAAEVGVPRATAARAVDYDADVGDHPFVVYNAPTLADFQITTHCSMGCPHCYASSSPDGAHVPLAEIEHVFAELSANGVTQVAIGGGEPLGHPDIVEVLRLCCERGMVPNLTTNGLHLDADLLAVLKRTCGAVALSLEGVGDKYNRVRASGFDFFLDRLADLRRHGIATVIQVTLSRENLDDLDEIVDFCAATDGLYGVIFLAYKEVGRGRAFDHTLAGVGGAEVFARLQRAFVRLSRHTRVGYDCCLTPGIVGVESDLGFGQHDQLEGCSALRSSMGVLTTLDVTPCTFTPELTVGTLREQTLFDVWRGEPARAFRARIGARMGDDRCRACPSRGACLGGCPVFDLVHCQRAPS